MADHAIDDTILHGPEAKDYFIHADRRVMIGLRATLDMLDLPLPEYAFRKRPGPAPSTPQAAYSEDNPAMAYNEPLSREPLCSRRLAAAVAKARARIARRAACRKGNVAPD